jgi:hypothetical protein
MKVAIQLAANPRSFKRNYPYFKENLLDTLNPDVFIHTWNLKGNERPDVITDGSCQEYIDLYKPKAWEIEDLHYNYEPLMTMVPHFTSRYKANQLRKKYQEENNIKYDVVICHRADVRLLNPFKMEYANMVTKDSLWTHHFRKDVDGLGAPQVNDYLFYTSPKWMDVVADCYHEMDKLNIYNPGSEKLMMYKLKKEGFNQDWVHLFGDTDDDILRPHLFEEGKARKSWHLFNIETIR